MSRPMGVEQGVTSRQCGAGPTPGINKTAGPRGECKSHGFLMTLHEILAAFHVYTCGVI